MLRKNPGFTCAGALTLALGIGANTAIFSVIDTVLLKPLPYAEADRLLMVWEKPPQGLRNYASEANYLDWRDQARSFSVLAAFTTGGFTLSGGVQAERVNGVRVTWDAFKMLAVRPIVGRGFTAADDQPGTARVAVLTHGFWQRKFGGDTAVIGRSIVLNGEPCTIIGVLPPDFRFFYAPDMFIPLALDPAKANRDWEYLVPVGKLKPGVTIEKARVEMAGIARNLAAAYPKTNQGWGIYLEPIRDAVVHYGWTQVLWLLFGAVSFVLLIACVNVANLMLAKAAARSRELAVRASLGASRQRLMTQVLAESVLLALAGGIVGVALAGWLVRLVGGLVPDFARAGLAPISVDARVLGFTVLLSLLTGIVFGVFPAWRASHPDLNEMLKSGARGSSGSLSQARFRGALVVLEIALSLVLLASAGLMLRSLQEMQRVDPGFQTERLLTMRLAMAENRYQAPPLRAYYRRVLETASALPGVLNASLSLGLPLEGAQVIMPFQIASHPHLPDAQAPGAPLEMVSSDFFRNLGIGLRKGRYFFAHDNEDAPRVAIVNEAFVRRYLPGEEALGKRLLMQTLIAASREVGPVNSWEIVGVVADVKYSGMNAKRPTPEMYLPLMQSPWPGAALSLRTSGEPLAVTQAARTALTRLDPDVPISAVRSMDQIASDSLLQSRVQTRLIGGFAAVALMMAALGIYALISYSVTQGTHDLGVRMALGADTADVLRLVLTRGATLTGAGLVVGLAGALALTRLLSSLLFQVKPGDPWTLMAVSALLALVAMVAGFIPAIRASRINPVLALRVE
jgi:putative ABC transport system permease protein